MSIEIYGCGQLPCVEISRCGQLLRVVISGSGQLPRVEISRCGQLPRVAQVQVIVLAVKTTQLAKYLEKIL